MPRTRSRPCAPSIAQPISDRLQANVAARAPAARSAARALTFAPEQMSPDDAVTQVRIDRFTNLHVFLADRHSYDDIYAG